MLSGSRLRVGRPFKTAEGVSYSQLWATQLSDEQKTELGITYEADPTPVDSTYYYDNGNPRDVANLKTAFIEDQKKIANNALQVTDWYVTRKAELGTAIPDNVVTYRAAVRTACTARETEINAAADTAALESLVKTPAKILDSDGETIIDNPATHLTQFPDPLS